MCNHGLRCCGHGVESCVCESPKMINTMGLCKGKTTLSMFQDFIFVSTRFAKFDLFVCIGVGINVTGRNVG